jgi:uncharacterized membrane protein
MIGAEQWVLINNGAPWVVAAIGVVLLTMASGHTTGAKRPAPIRLSLFGVRMLAVTLALIAVLRPAREEDLVRNKRSPLAVVVDQSRSMALGDPSAGVSALEWLDDNAGALAALEKNYKLQYWSLTDPPGELAGLGDGAKTLPVESFNRDETPLGSSLEELIRFRPELSGIVLLSDGFDTDNPRHPPTLSVPVYPVLPAETEMLDLWIDEVRAPPVAFIRTPVELKVSLGAVGIGASGASVELTLLEEGRVVSSQLIEADALNEEVSLVFTPRRTGRKAFELSASPLPGENVTENNRKRFSLDVIRDKTRVLLVGGTPTWDSKFLRRRLRQDPGIDLITFMILRTPADIMNTKQGELSLIPFPTEELFNTELSSFDVVILTNFDYAPYMPRRYLDNMERFVREAGGGLVMLGGDRSFGLGGYAKSPLEKVLPVDLSGAIPGRQFRAGPFRARLTEEGLDHPIFAALPEGEKNRQLWEDIGELEGLNWSLRARPGAMVAMETPQVKNEYGAAPVIALGDYGAGRSMAVLTDSLWRWKMPYAARGGDETVYREFWTRALRWLVHDPEMELVRIAPLPENLRAGTEVRFSARVLDRSYQPAKGAMLKGKFTPATSLEGSDAGDSGQLVWVEERPGEYISEPVVLPGEGLWKVETEALQGAQFLGSDEVGFPVGPASPESQRMGVDREYLSELAEKSGGQVVEDDSAPLFKLLSQRGEAEVEVVGRTVSEPWANIWYLALAILLFGVDWLLRRVLE